MKSIAAALIVLVAGARPAAAGTLVTGVIRDQDGGAIPGARVVALDASGAKTGADIAAADGTFALDSAHTPVSAIVTCAYCADARIPIPYDAPVIAIVHRYSALREGPPSVADIAALPYRRIGEIAAVVPFAVTRSGLPSDRGLNAGRGAVLLDGAATYRVLDGRDAAAFVPSGALAALAVRSPLTAPLYGAYASGGTFALDTTDIAAPSRADGGGTFEVALRSGSDLRATFAQSSDPEIGGARRSLAALYASTPFAGGMLEANADATAGPFLNGVNGALRYASGSRRYETFAGLQFAGSGYAGTSFGGYSDDIRVEFRVRNRGAIALESGFRLRRSSGGLRAYGTTDRGSQQEDAVFADAHAPLGAGTVAVAVALQRQRDGRTVAFTEGTNAIVASLAFDVPLSTAWSVHAGAAAGVREPALVELLPLADAPFGRSALIEAALRYTDGRRVRLAAIAYHERSPATVNERVGGIGIEGAWQISPDVSLRAWALRAGSLGDGTLLQRSAIGYPGTVAAPLRANLVWLSYGRTLRFDVLVRGGPLEGDAIVPISAHTALALGTLVRDRIRIMTIGVRTR